MNPFRRRTVPLTPAPPPPFAPFAGAPPDHRNLAPRWLPEFMGETRAAPIVSAPAQVGAPVYLPSRMADLNEAHELIPAAFAAIHHTATAASNLPITVYERRSGKDEPIAEHPIAEMLHPAYGRFNPWTTAQVGWYLTFAQHLLYGAAYLLKDPVFNGRPDELHLLQPDWVRPVRGLTRPVASWQYEPPGKKVTYTVDQVIPFPFPNPRDPAIPHVPLIAARKAMLLELYQMQFNQDFFENGATLGGVVTLKQPMLESTLKAMAERFNEDHAGRGKGHRWRFVGGAEDVVELGKSMKDLQFDEGLRRTMQYVLMTLGVPPVVVGSLDGATYANAQEQVRMYLQGTIQPICRFRDAVLNLYLARAWGDRLYIQTDFSGLEALLPGEDVVANTVGKYFDSGLISFGEGRQWISTRKTPTLAADPERDPLFKADLYPAVDPFAALDPNSPDDPEEPEDPPAGEESAARGRRRRPARRRARTVDPMDRFLETVIREGEIREIREREARRVEKEAKVTAAVDRELKRIRAAYRGNLAAQKEAILQAIREGRLTPLDLAPVQDLIRALRQDSTARVSAAYDKVVAKFGTSALTDLGASVAFNATSETVLRYVANTAAKNVRLVDDGTAAIVRGKIQDALLESQILGENTTETATRLMESVVDETFSDMSRVRATTIAHTETAQAFNFADKEAWTQSGVVEEKEWHNQADDKVRSIENGDEFDHSAMEGVKVALDQPFQVPKRGGGYEEIDFPSDPNGSAANSIECRCFMTPVLSPRYLVNRLCSQVEDANRSIAASAAGGG